MKRICLFLLIAGFTVFSYSQVFNTGTLLKPGTFSIGVNPIVVDENLDNEIRVNLYGGYGLSQYVDVSFRYQLMENKDYFGADFEFAVHKSKKLNVSVIAGGHVRYDTGLDGTVCVSYPLNYFLTVFTGLDADLVFDEDETQPYVWLPLGTEIKWTRKISAIIEVDLPMSNFAWNILGIGLKFYI